MLEELWRWIKLPFAILFAIWITIWRKIFGGVM